MPVAERRAYELNLGSGIISPRPAERRQRVAFSQDTGVAIGRFDVNGDNPVFQKLKLPPAKPGAYLTELTENSCEEFRHS